jgi:hypothetical protein
MIIGIHVRMVNNYGGYTTVSLSKKSKGHIWLNIANVPTQTAVNVRCCKCLKRYFIKYKPENSVS